MLAEKVFNDSLKYLKEMPREKRKQIGQFFTSLETAKYMASMFRKINKAEVSILDPGAGSGILTAAVVDSLQDNQFIKKINVVCYETSEDVLPLLKNNLSYLKENSCIPVNYEIITLNYITSQRKQFNDTEDADSSRFFDIVISNPPYKKISKKAAESFSMAKVCHGAPNLYFLFMAMGLFNLKPSGEAVFIIPRSWTSGAYFEKFREYFLSNGTLKWVHLFVRRDKVFENEKVLQETIIVKIDKSDKKNDIRITTSESNSDFCNMHTMQVPYNDIVVGKRNYVYLVTSENDLQKLQAVNKFGETLTSLELKMKTGLVVDFRCLDYIRNTNEKNSVPLFYAHNFKNGKIQHPVGKVGEYISTEKRGLIQKNKNLLMIKRFSSKEEFRRLQPAIYLADKYKEFSYISTHNKVNFIEALNGELTKAQVFGLYVVFNSTLYDGFYRVLNGSTQVNSTEINEMPLPSMQDIEKLGNELIKANDLSVNMCDNLMERLLLEHEK